MHTAPIAISAFRGLTRKRPPVSVGVLLASVILGGIILVALGAPWFAPFDPQAQALEIRLEPPFAAGHPLGTDYLGRDLLSRLIWGARASLAVGATTVLFTGAVGVTLGALGAYFGGLWDSATRMLINVRLSFPFILLALAVVAVLGPSLRNVILTLAATLWVQYAVVIRNQVLVLREQEFVMAARAIGAGDLHILVRHVLRNVVGTVLVIGTLGVAEAILAESFLSFLGLGVPLPTPSWGNMLAEGRVYALSMWWVAAIPGIAIFATTLSVLTLGDALRHRVDPVHRRRI